MAEKQAILIKRKYIILVILCLLFQALFCFRYRLIFFDNEILNPNQFKTRSLFYWGTIVVGLAAISFLYLRKHRKVLVLLICLTISIHLSQVPESIEVTFNKRKMESLALNFPLSAHDSKYKTEKHCGENIFQCQNGDTIFYFFLYVRKQSEYPAIEGFGFLFYDKRLSEITSTSLLFSKNWFVINKPNISNLLGQKKPRH